MIILVRWHSHCARTHFTVNGNTLHFQTKFCLCRFLYHLWWSL